MSAKTTRLLKVLAVAVVLGFAAQALVRYVLFRPSLPEDAEVGVRLGRAGEAVTVLAADLEVPWEIGFLEDGFLVTERPGRLTRLAADGSRIWSVDVPGVRARGEGGLMGLALHPRFAANRWIYLLMTTESDNRIVRYALGERGALEDEYVVLAGIPAAVFHDGGRLAFGPDGLLYATTGDAGSRSWARDPASLAGKILRMTDEGEPVPGSGGYVHSLGHRNPQGLAWDAQGRLWATEHGRSGATSGMDELNLIEPGGDFGWPESQGDVVVEGTLGPVLHSGPDWTWAPGGAAVLEGRVLFAGLRGQALYEVDPSDTEPRVVAHFFGDFGRLRTVRLGPDGLLYLLTSNRDGRGSAGREDDRVLRVDPAVLERTGSDGR